MFTDVLLSLNEIQPLNVPIFASINLGGDFYAACCFKFGKLGALQKIVFFAYAAHIDGASLPSRFKGEPVCGDYDATPTGLLCCLLPLEGARTERNVRAGT